MSTLRSLVAVALLLALATLAACGGGPGGSTAATSSTGASTGGEESTGGEPSEPAATQSTGGAPAGDLDGLINALVPPNSTEISKTTAEGGAFISYSSTDSRDSLKNHYESAIPAAGMQIFSRTEVSDTNAWVFAQSEGSSFGGSVTVAPAQDGGSGSTVIVTVSAG
ncbi:MAG TPA: hypothetical protein VH987_08345 [Candidatus Limnocylindria bacterium]|jgi:hypothetical protein